MNYDVLHVFALQLTRHFTRIVRWYIIMIIHYVKVIFHLICIKTSYKRL